MLLAVILALSGVSILLWLLWRTRASGYALLTVCTLAVYLLQPSTPIRYLDFWLPTATLGLVFFSWLITTPPAARSGRENLLSGMLLVGVTLAVALTRYLDPLQGLIPGRPPQFGGVVWVLLLLGLLSWWIGRARRASGVLLSTGMILIGVLLLQLKVPEWTQSASAGLRLMTGQSPQLATGADIRWLGFSW
jgi:alginate O-acetyltransferase complex protein AlgI